MKFYRIWFHCVLALSITSIFGWSYGFLMIMLPLPLLTQNENYNLNLSLSIFYSCFWTSIQMVFTLQILQAYPLLMFVVVGIFMLIKFVRMLDIKNFNSEFMGVLIGSIILNLGSYDFFDIEDFIINLWIISLSMIFTTAFVFWILPEPKYSSKLSEKIESKKEVNFEAISRVATGWFATMSVFLIFQTFDLYDSLSSQATALVLIAPMTFLGAISLVKARIIGTGIGCTLGLCMQLLLDRWFSNTLLFIIFFSIFIIPICYWLAKDGIKKTIALSAMPAMTVPLTTSVIPEQQDAIYSLLYRFSSVFFSIVVTIITMWFIQRLVKLYLMKHPNLLIRIK